MPTKISPLTKTGGGGTGGGGKAGSKSGTKSAAVRKPRLFSTSRFTAATEGLSRVTAAQGKGSLQAVLFTGCVGLGLLVLGSVLVHIGDDDYIVDLMVLGGLFIVMGTGALVLGCFFMLRPCYSKRGGSRPKGGEGSDKNATLPPGPSPDDNVFNPAFLLEDLPLPQPVPGTSTLPPASNDLYDRVSLGVMQAAKGGRLAPPSPPPLSQPPRQRERTSSTVLTTVEAESDEVSELGDGEEAVR